MSNKNDVVVVRGYKADPLPPSEEFRKAIQEEIDAEIMEAILKAVQDTKKEKP